MTTSPDSGNAQRTQSRWRTAVEGLTTALLLVAAVTIIWRNVWGSTPTRRPAPEVVVPTDLQQLEGAQLNGNRQAPVAVIAYSEFQCPYCGQFARDIFPRIDKEYVQPGKVLFAFRHSPIEAIHPLALKAAEAAECAGRQGRFWPMHDVLFRQDSSLDSGNLLTLAVRAGLDVGEAKKCFDEDGSVKVRSDRASAVALRLSGTPAFLIGTTELGGVRVTTILKGSRPFTEFAAAFDGLLRKVAR